MMEDGWHSGFGYGHWAFSLFFWIVIVGAIILALRSGGSRSDGGPSRSAREVLDERYARGEIDREEYRRRREDLEGRSPRS
jgi:putative membrane protein